MALFRLIAGTHMQGGKVYRHNDPTANTMESKENLAALDPGKWERADDHPAPYVYSPQENRVPQAMPPLTPTTAGVVDPTRNDLEERYGGFDSLTLQELKEVAGAEEIKLPKGATTREEVIKVLRGGK